MKKTDLAAYNKYIRKKWIVLLVMVGLLFASAIASLSVGSAKVSIPDILRTVFGGGTRQQNAIIWNVRMPRVATAMRKFSSKTWPLPMPLTAFHKTS